MSPSPPGTPPRSGAPRPLRGIPRSRAYWELKAEQMMNRVFDPEAVIEIGGEPGENASPGQHRQPLQPSGPAATPMAQAPSKGRAQASAPVAEAGASRRHDQSLLLITAFCGICLVSAASSIFYVSHWNRLQQSLSQERNLLLVERLRNLGPATATPLTGPEPAAPTLPQPSLTPSTSAGSSADGLPPPPPEEPWMQQLSNLPGSGQPAAGRSTPGLLRVPVSPQVTLAPVAALPAGETPPRPAAGNAPLPQLVGVVGAAGKAASAIFLVGGTSMGVGSGETIGSSGWRLRSAAGETALIERGGEVRQVSIINGF
ncbi:MAG: hypothetical protein WCI65_08260 [Synechococcaceae cyanobacterium ELA263]